MDELDPRFKIRAPLRCDGIGRLDCAEDLESGMRMAVRWLPLEANGTAAVVACEQLPEHPTLPRIRQIGQMGASAYVAMEFPDGNLLATRAGESLDGASLIGITAQIADALATIHSQDVFHGEMSADSVLLVSSPSEKAFLWDMPLVIANRLTDRRGEDRLMTQLVKTAPYLAPERARGARASAESDVYALGAIICVAGGAPLPVAETTLAVIHAVVSSSWVPRVPKSIPEPLRSMLDRMISRSANERPTAREVADLFMPPVAAHKTLPEMAAVVLPPVVATKPADIRLTRVTAPAMAAQSDARATARLELSEAIDAAVKEARLPDSSEPLPEAKATAPSPAVSLTDNVSVSHELHQAGAVLLTAEEAALLPRPSRKAPLLMAAVMGVLVMVLAALAIDLAHRTPVAAARPPAPTPISVKTVRPAPLPAPEPMVASPTVVEEEDDLSPLTPRPAKKVRRSARPASQVTAQGTGAQTPATAPAQGDFGFLEEEPELKRPSF